MSLVLRGRLTAALWLALACAAAADAQPTVRVRLFAPTFPTSVTVGAPDRSVDVLSDGAPVGHLSQGATLTLSVEGRQVQARGGGLAVVGSRIEIDGPTDIAAGRTRRSYSGRLLVGVEGGRLQIVNHVVMPEYVASVVASEYPFREIEGVKAQAILARTYAARRLGDGVAYDLDDHQGSQVYGGRTASTEISRRATMETLGEVLTYHGDLAEALYSSSSGGHTADNEDIWGSAPVPYLRGVPDPFDAESPDSRWRTTADRGRVLAALGRAFGGRVTGFDVTQRDDTGRVLSIRVHGASRSSVSGTAFRAAVNAAVGWRTVRSTHFSATVHGGEIVFEGRGFGHGVGMSQYGAHGQALAGRSYLDILDFYFGGTDVSVLPGFAPPEAPDYASGPVRRMPTPRSEGVRRWPTRRSEARDPTATPPAAAPPAVTPHLEPPAPAPHSAPRASEPKSRRTAW